MKKDQKIIKSDLTVVGGGVAGISAAISAARHGLSVALVQDRPMLGGNHSSECRVHLSSSAERGLGYYNREVGLADEMKQSILHYNPRYNRKLDYDLTDMALFNMVKQEKNIQLFFNTAAYEVEVEEEIIKKVYAYNQFTDVFYTFESDLFADASGNGVIAYKCGAEFMVGREAKNQFQETFAPEEADHTVMGSCILFTVGVADHEVPFVKPEFAYDYEEDGILKWVNRPETGRTLPTRLQEVDGIWWLSYGGAIDTIKDYDEINLELKKLVYGFWDYVKNSGAYENTENYFINWIAPFPAMRESRRFKGDYVITEHDILKKTNFEDGIATGGWSIDIHDTSGTYGSDLTSKFGRVDALYNIPYRVTYSKDIANLYLCGRIISASHVALGSLRVMQTLATVAQSTGVSAYLCKKYGVLPKAISQGDYLEEMKRLLQRDGVYLQDKAEDVGLVRKAKVTASQVVALENSVAIDSCSLDSDVAFALPVSQLEEMKIKVKALEDTTLQVEICEGNDPYMYQIHNVLCKQAYKIEKGFDDWFTITPQVKGIRNNRAYVVLKANENLEIYFSSETPVGTPSFFLKNNVFKRLYTIKQRYQVVYKCIAFKEVKPDCNTYGPQNIINGYHRPTTDPNIWLALKGDSPETLTFDFEEPITVKELQLIFNAELEKDHFNAPISSLIKDYDVIVAGKNGTKVIEKRNNYLARCVLPMEETEVTQIVLKVYDNYGARYLGVYGVKIF